MEPETFAGNLSRMRLWQVTTIATLALLILSAPGCISTSRFTGSADANELTISAAVSLKDAFNEIAALNEKRTGAKVRFNYGASGALQKQIESGAPVDVFASAGAKQMDNLVAGNFVASETRQDFARNSLVLIAPVGQTSINSFDDLTNPAVSKVAVGNPKTVPAGQYAEQALNKLKLLPQIQSKLILAEDVRQVLDYVIRDEVDAGVVYSSDAFSADHKVRVVARASEDSHDPILYPIAVVRNSRQQEAARRFIEVVLSAEGQAILVKHGFPGVKK